MYVHSKTHLVHEGRHVNGGCEERCPSLQGLRAQPSRSLGHDDSFELVCGKVLPDEGYARSQRHMRYVYGARDGRR